MTRMESKRNRATSEASRVTSRRSDANEDFKEINKSLKNYKKANDLEIVFNGKKFVHEPHIRNFYDPSDEMKEYMTPAIGTMGLVGGWTGGKIISQLL